MNLTNKRVLYLSILVWLCTLGARNQEDSRTKGLNSITEKAVNGQLGFLSSDWTEGRAAGEPGSFMAADYIASMFMVYGLEPVGDINWIYPSPQERIEGKRAVRYRSYFQDFQVIKSVPVEEQILEIIAENGKENITLSFACKTDFDIYGLTVGKEFSTSIVFAGYGLVHEESGYNDYKGVDVRGKVVMILSGYPGHNDTTSSACKIFMPSGKYGNYYMKRSKVKDAADRGAVAIIQVDPSGEDIYEDFAENYPLRINREYYEGGRDLNSIYDYTLRLPGDTLDNDPLELSLSKRALNFLINGSGVDFEAFEERAEQMMKPESIVLKGKMMHLKTKVNSEVITIRNVVGMIRGKDTSRIIVVGAHYDHLGTFGGYVWNGADDNASGTVGMMTIAKAFAESGETPEKSIVFAAWTGEEKGLLGSTWFADHPLPEGSDIIMNLNYDMISRDSRNDSLGVECSMSYPVGYSYLEKLSEKNNEDFDIGLKIRYRESSGKGGGSDYAPFSRKGIPYFYFMAGWHSDYHNPGDHASKANTAKMTKIIQLGYLNVWAVANNKTTGLE